MSNLFVSPINGGKLLSIEQRVRDAIDEAGKKTIVFVEGYDDQVIFEILYEGNIAFIYTGGCIKVKEYVQHFSDKKRFFGIIDRDFRTDEEVKAEMDSPTFNHKLYIFFERYTLENYLIEPQVLLEFLKDESINDKGLIPLSKNFSRIKQIIDEIFRKLLLISAGNWTLLFFGKEFLKKNTPADENIIIKKILKQLNKSEPEECQRRYQDYKNLIPNEGQEIQKYVSGKYFFYHFNKAIKEETEVNINIGNARGNLARILKLKGLSGDLIELGTFIGFQDSGRQP